MKKETILLEKYTIKRKNKIYYVIVNNTKHTSEFYINNKLYGFIDFMLGFNILECGYTNNQDVIENYVDEWINIYEKDIKKLERKEA